MKNILIFVSGYLPGFKSGGPVRTVSNMVDSLGNEFRFYIICLDRDLGDKHPYTSIEKNQWNAQGNANVLYIQRNLSGMLKILQILSSQKFDIIHLNSFFSFQFSIFPLLATKLLKTKSQIILGPRGEFSEGAIKLKSLKKNTYIRAIRLANFYHNIIWHASSTYEVQDIKRAIGKNSKIRQAIDIAKLDCDFSLQPRSLDNPLKIVFISRISPKKNLIGALNILSKVNSDIDFYIHGPIEDDPYWQECLKLSNNLPSHVKLHYCGPLSPKDVSKTISGYDLFLFPTLGENFGHVIAEALFSGLPVLISNTTPWRNLSDKKLGWDLPIEEINLFAKCIDDCCKISSNEYNNWRINIKNWAQNNIGNKNAINENRNLFNSD